MKKWWALGLAVLLIAATSAAALAKVENPKVVKGDIGKYGGTFIDYIESDPKTFNYVLSKDNTSTGVTRLLMFEGLTEMNYWTGEFEPGLAEKWEFSKDGKTWTFELRKGVTWSDGKPFTADDVIFSFQLYFDKENASSTRDVFTIDGQLPQVKKIDDYTVQLVLPKPFAPMLGNMTAPMLPKHKLEAAYKAGKFTTTWGVNAPVKDIVGTGPWVLADYKPGQRIVYTRNPRYWRVDEKGNQLPYMQRLILQIVPNAETASLKFKAGELSGYTVRPEEYRLYKQGERNGNYTVLDGGPDSGTLFLVLNQNPNTVKAPKLSWFTNVKFRQALAHAIDKQTMIDSLYDGLAEPQWAAISVADKLFSNKNVKKYQYDLKKAAEILESAGFKKGADGVLKDPKGNPVEFDLATNSNNTVRVRAANLMKEDFGKLGIKVNFQPIAFNKLLEQLLTTFDWDAIVIGLTGTFDPNGGANTWTSKGGLHMWYPREPKPQTAWEARLDELFEQGAITLDQKERKKIYDEYQQIVSEEVPMIYTVNQKQFAALRNSIGNVRYNARGGYFWNSYQIYIK